MLALRNPTLAALVIVLACALRPACADDRPPDAADVAEGLGDRPADAQRATELTRRAIGLIGRKNWKDAEGVLKEALDLVPDEPVNLYNLACAKAQLGQADASVDCLERAAAAGFSDFVLIGRDPDLAPARALPRFNTFIAQKDQW